MYKRIYWVVIAVLGLFSPALFALGLGGAVVESYLNQQLDVRVELISQSSEELQSITAGLASVDDFELLGLSRSAITVPLEFELVTDTANPYIHITSKLNVNEPVIQVLVEVVWANGRMLREYTLFLDPPTFDSPAPSVALRSTPKSAPVSVPSQDSTPPPAAIVRLDPVPEVQEPVTEEPAPRQVLEEEPVTETPDEEDSIEAEPVAEEALSEEPAEVESALDEESPEESAVTEPTSEDSTSEADSLSDQETEQESEQSDEQLSGEEIYGPVARGETLWGIARDFSRGSSYSINQTMLALQRKNPEAFINGNINSLKRGAILRLPAYSEVGELSTREAMLEVMRQEEEQRTGIRSVAPDFGTPTLADSGDYQETTSESVPEPLEEEEAGHLELVPPAEEEITDPLLDELTPEQPVVDDSVKEELARTEEDLVNAQQENTYLTQRIEELEAQVQAQSDTLVGIEDTGLANVESSLAQERASNHPEPPVAITPGGEDQPWYAGNTYLIAGIAIVLVALIVWGLRRRNAGQVEAGLADAAVTADVEPMDAPQTQDSEEGETVVQVRPEPEPEPEPEPDIEPEPEPEPEDTIRILDMDEGETVVQPTPELKPVPASATVIDFADEDEEGEASDDDPEIKLDLARAYLSLGDKEASKSMLDEVLSNGNEAQKAEARQMLDEF